MLHKNFVKNDIQLELFGGQSKILVGNCPPAAPGYVPAFTDYISKQAWRQSSVTGEGRKIFGDTLLNFFLKFGSEDQGKVFIPNYALWIRDLCLLSGHNSRLERGRHVYRLERHNGNLWCGSRFLPTNSGMNIKKKVFCTKS